MLAALVAVLSPLRDVLSRDPLAAIAAQEGAGDAHSAGWLALAGVVSLAAATALLHFAPDAAIPVMVLLVAALLLELPLALSVTLALARKLARLVVSPVGHVAAMELSAARVRAVAIAATAAVAVFGSVAIQGARSDLLAGLDGATRETNASTDVWVSPAGAYKLLHTAPFTPTQQTALERVPGVRTVSLYRSGLLDYGERRALVIAPAPRSTPLLPAGQIVDGNARQAEARVRAGGWLILSRGLAAEAHLQIGEAFTLPSPEPTSFRVAALSTNLGWAPGAIVMNGSDYAHAWASRDASAYSIQLARNVSPGHALERIERVLNPSAGAAPISTRAPRLSTRPAPASSTSRASSAARVSARIPRSGLAAQSSAQRVAREDALDGEALSHLNEISTLTTLFAILAIAAAIAAMLWQRRPRLAKLKLEGLPHGELWRTILLESMLLLAAGCLTGAIFGLYAQQLADEALANAMDFPVVHSLAPLTALGSLALVTGSALAILAIPGYLAARVPAALALQD